MSTSVMFLVNAEARARLGNLSGVVTRLNQLRAVCGPRLSTDGEALLQLVDDIHL